MNVAQRMASFPVLPSQGSQCLSWPDKSILVLFNIFFGPVLIESKPTLP
jgi:hypothetical protein